MIKFRRIFTLFLTVIVVFSICYQPVQAELIPISKLDEVEKIIYGQPTKLPIMQRITTLEKTLYDSPQKGAIKERINNIVSYVLNSEPSLVFLINSLEWTLMNQTDKGDILTRVGELETIVFGSTQHGSLIVRVNKLSNIILGESKIPAQKVDIPAGTMIKISLLEKIDSGMSRNGQKYDFEVVRDVTIENNLIIPEGTRGKIAIASLEEAGKFGKNAELSFTIDDLPTISGNLVPVNFYIEDKKNGDDSRKMAVGISMLGAVILSNPVGLIAGFFYEGKDLVIQSGTEFMIESIEEVTTYGITMD